MTQGAILRGIISAAMEVVNPGNIKADPATPIHLHLGDVYVRSNVLILGDRDLGNTACAGAISSVAREGHDASLDAMMWLWA